MAAVDLTLTKTKSGSFEREIGVASVAAAAVADAATVVAGSEINIGPWLYVAWMLLCTVKDVTVNFYGANLADFSDEVIINTSAISLTAGTPKGYTGGTTGLLTSGTAMPYQYMRMKASNAVAGQTGQLAFTICAKNT